MLRFLNIFLIFIVATICYWLGLLILAPLGLSINIIFAFSIIVAVLLPQRYGYTFAFFSGLFLDFLGTLLFGSHALAFTLLMILFYHIKENIDFKEMVPQMIITAMLNFLLIIVFGLISKIFMGIFIWQGWKDLFFGSIILGLIMPGLYNLVFKFLFFNVLNKANEG